MSETQAPNWSAKRFLWTGIITLFVLIFGLGAWSVFTKIAGAVVASGVVEVDSSRQIVQHGEGGVVAGILVGDGDHVEAGATLIRLDGTLLRSELAIVEGQLYELLARLDRLRAERDEADSITFAPDLLNMAVVNTEVRKIIDGQADLFVARLTSTQEEITQLVERKAQLVEQITGIEAQVVATTRQHSIVVSELTGQETLLDSGLTQLSQVSALQREEASLSGHLGELTATLAQVRGQITEIEIETLRLSSNRREEAITTLIDLQYSTVELRERRLSLSERINRLDIKAPRSGVIYGLQVKTLRAVITAAEPILYVVPQDSYLVIRTRINAIDIDQLELNQQATLRFSAFDTRTTPELDGYVTNISADIFTDEATGATFYTAELLPVEGEIEKLKDNQILPGMPVEVLIRTGDRSPMDYLLKPLAGYFYRAFREE